MGWEEAESWQAGNTQGTFYADTLKDAAERPARDAERKKIISPEDMPWENAPQGLLKHLVNDSMNARVETVDVYMQIIPPGSKSGRHRHLAEEALYVLEGRGYDLHVDCDVEITDTYHWTPQDQERRFDWAAGDMIYIPPNTIHQHFNADPERPARLVSATNRIYKWSGLNDLEQVENAPEYEPGAALDAEIIKKYLEPKHQ
jgi:quercetin dioxygenase-like cupin family protein